MKLKEYLRPAPTALLIGLAVFAICGSMWRAGLFSGMELRVYDAFIHARANPNATDPRIVLVELTESDINTLDYPLRDKVLATVFDKIESGHPDVIGNDFYRDLPVPRDGKELGDLNDVLIHYPNIISIFLYGDPQKPFAIPPPPIHAAGPNADPSRYGCNNLTGAGVNRRGILFMPWGKDFTPYESFALSLAQYYFLDHNVAIEQKGNQLILGKTAIPQFRGNDGGYVGEFDVGYQFLLDFRGASTFTTYSVSDVLAMKDTSVFKDKIVLLGIAADSSNDRFSTPVSGGTIPGVEIHAQVVENLLRVAINGDRPTTSYGLGFGWTWLGVWCLAGVALGLFVRSYYVAILGGLAGVALITLLGWWSFLGGYWILVFAPACAFVFTTGLVKFYAATHEGEEREKLMKLFAQRLSPEIAEEIWDKRETFLKGGVPAAQRLTITVLFTDLKNYSTISEGMTPPELIAWINECQSALARHVSTNRGIICCFMGDGMMAVFGIPVPRTDEDEIQRDAINAVTCAFGMAKEIEHINDKWRAQGKPLVGLRIGINTGEAMAGDLGIQNTKVEYSVIGYTVNTASRLESVDKEGAFSSPDEECRILIGARTYNYVKDAFIARHVGSVTLNGKAATTEVYKVLASTPESENNPKIT